MARSKQARTARPAPTALGPELSAPLRPKNLTVQQPELYREARGVGSEKLVCTNVGRPGFECQSEIEFPNDKDIAKLKLDPAKRVYIHKCVRPGSFEGDFVPVDSVEEAVKVATSHCDCVRPNLVESTASARRKCQRRAVNTVA